MEPKHCKKLKKYRKKRKKKINVNLCCFVFNNLVCWRYVCFFLFSVCIYLQSWESYCLWSGAHFLSNIVSGLYPFIIKNDLNHLCYCLRNIPLRVYTVIYLTCPYLGCIGLSSFLLLLLWWIFAYRLSMRLLIHLILCLKSLIES